MLRHHYDHTTKVYSFSDAAIPDKRDPNRFLCPANASLIELPQFNSDTEELVFDTDNDSWTIRNIVLPDPVVDYMGFWVSLIGSSYYAHVKSEASTSLMANVTATEFIALLGDAKAGMPVVPAIQASLDSLLSIVPASAEEQALLTALFASTNMDFPYSLNF